MKVVPFNGKEVDRSSIVLNNIDPRDRPDFCDAYIAEAKYTDGTELGDFELGVFNDDNRDLVNELAHESFH